jgi:hypothetical protein
VIRGLASLAARRVLAPGVLALLTAVLWLSLRANWGAGSPELIAEAGEQSAALARSSMREAVWSIAVLAILPLFVARAARTVGAWRSGEGDWLGSRAAGRGSILVSTWLGTWLGGAILLAIVFLAVEGSAGSFAAGNRTWRRAGTIALPRATWITAASQARWTAGTDESAWPAGSRARIELAFGAGTGAAAEVVLRARRGGIEGSTQERSARARFASRGAVEVELPSGEWPLAFEIACVREGSRAFVVSDAMEVWEPGARESSASLEILERLAIALGAWTALAIGLGAWLSAPTAALALGAAWIPAWLADRPPAWLPAADLWSALAIAGSGRVPHAADPSALAPAALLIVFGLALGAAGLRRWRTAR